MINSCLRCRTWWPESSSYIWGAFTGLARWERDENGPIKTLLYWNWPIIITFHLVLLIWTNSFFIYFTFMGKWSKYSNPWTLHNFLPCSFRKRLQVDFSIFYLNCIEKFHISAALSCTTVHSSILSCFGLCSNWWWVLGGWGGFNEFELNVSGFFCCLCPQ